MGIAVVDVCLAFGQLSVLSIALQKRKKISVFEDSNESKTLHLHLGWGSVPISPWQMENIVKSKMLLMTLPYQAAWLRLSTARLTPQLGKSCSTGWPAGKDRVAMLLTKMFALEDTQVSETLDSAGCFFL